MLWMNATSILISSISIDVAKLSDCEYNVRHVIAEISDNLMIVSIMKFVNCAHLYSGSGKKRRS